MYVRDCLWRDCMCLLTPMDNNYLFRQWQNHSPHFMQCLVLSGDDYADEQVVIWAHWKLHESISCFFSLCLSVNPLWIRHHCLNSNIYFIWCHIFRTTSRRVSEFPLFPYTVICVCCQRDKRNTLLALAINEVQLVISFGFSISYIKLFYFCWRNIWIYEYLLIYDIFEIYCHRLET